MARTIKLKESDLTKIVRKISESKGLVMEKWVLRPWVKQVITIGKAIGNIISVWSWCCASDSRLKKNIRRVGKSPSGIPIYEFEYKNKVRFGGGTFRGVLAEQTPRKATKVMSNGYRYVNYNMIDVDFEKVNPKTLNEQQFVFVCEPGSCACVPEFFTGGGAFTYQTAKECQNDTNNCCEKVIPPKKKKTRLKESDLTRVIKKVLNEKFFDDRSMEDILNGGPGPYNPFGGGGDDPWTWNTGGGDPMAAGNEEMDIKGGGMGQENAAKIKRVKDELGRVLQHSSAMAADISSGRNNPGWDAEKSALTVEVDALIQQAYQELTNTGKITRETYTWAQEVNAQAKKFNLWHWLRGLFMIEVPDDDEDPE